MNKAKKFMNNPRDVVPEMLEGLVAASGRTLRKLDQHHAVVRSSIPAGKVGLLIGGGSGHEPMFAGFVGENLADAAACGNVFAAPDPETILAATREVSQGKGVLYVYGNYAGDNMNFDIAAEIAEGEGIPIKTVRVWDDIAIADVEERRGIAGDLCVIKIAGAAAADENITLDDLYSITAQARDNTRSLAVATKPGSTPETGEPTFELPDDELEIGMGAHGEPGVSREKMQSADQITEKMVAQIVEDLPFKKGDDVALVINNLGSTTMMELWIVNRAVNRELSQRGINIHDTRIGSFITTQEMGGFSITLTRLDDTLRRYYDAPCSAFGFTSTGGSS